MTLVDLIARWRVFMAAVLMGCLAGALAAVFQQPVYVAQMTISAVGIDETSVPPPSLLGLGGGSSVLRAISGAAGRASFESSDIGYFVALLDSDRVVSKLIEQQEVTEELFPGEWDDVSRTWRRKPGLLSAVAATYRRVFYGVSYQQPNVARAKRALTKRFSVTFDLDSNTYTLRMKGKSCEVATSLMRRVFDTGDSVLKAEKRVRYSENVDLLMRQLANPPNTAIQSDIANALIAQQLRRITTESELPIAARVIDGPGCGDRPHLPQPVAYTFAGGLAGFMCVLAFFAWKAWRLELMSRMPLSRGVTTAEHRTG